MTTKKEVLANKIKNYLNKQPECKCIKIHGSMYTELGTPDIIGCYKGRMFAFEVKMPGKEKTITKIQKFRLEEWMRSGAIVGMVSSIDTIKNFMK